jgi:hypothetical protein
MSSVLAIVSKAVFEKMVSKGVAVGDLVKTDCYVSNQAAFAQLGKGDALFLVTATGADITAKKGALGMSLQTPRLPCPPP